MFYSKFNFILTDESKWYEIDQNCPTLFILLKSKFETELKSSKYMQRVIYVHGTPRLFCLSKAPCVVSKSEKAHHTIGNNSNLGNWIMSKILKFESYISPILVYRRNINQENLIKCGFKIKLIFFSWIFYFSTIGRMCNLGLLIDSFHKMVWQNTRHYLSIR